MINAGGLINAHSHTNKTILNELSENSEGTLLYKGKEIKGQGNGSNVSIKQSITSGTQIASITIDEIETILYIPTDESSITDADIEAAALADKF